MSRSGFRTAVRGLLAESENDLATTRLPYSHHTDMDYVARLARVHVKHPTIIDHTRTKSPAIELDLVTKPEPVFFLGSDGQIKMSNTSLSSEESAEAASPVFTLRRDSKRSSKNTSILLDEDQDQDQNTGGPLMQLNDGPLDLQTPEQEMSHSPAQQQQGERHTPNEINRDRLRIPPSKPHHSVRQHGNYGEPSCPISVPGLDFFRLPPPIITHFSTAKQPLTASVLTSFAPTLIRWRLLTFYGVFFHTSIQRDVAEDAYAFFASKANQIHGVDWLKTWEILQEETRNASKSRLLREGRKWLRSHFSSSVSRIRSNESVSVRHVINTTAIELNIPPTQLELAIESLALALEPNARRFSGIGLAEMKQWSRLADVLLEDSDALDNPLGPAWMMKPTVEVTPMTMLSLSIWSRRFVLKNEDNGMVKDGWKDIGKTKAGEDDSVDMVLHKTNSCDALVPLTGILFAHKACKQRYFRLLERDEKEKVFYKLSAQEGKLEGMEDSGKEIRPAENGKDRRSAR